LRYPKEDREADRSEYEQDIANPNQLVHNDTKYTMKSIKIAGLCLVAMLAMGLVTAVSASAEVPAWEHCTKGVVGHTPTKYESNQCSTINNSTGEWEWREVNGTEKVVSHLSLQMGDRKVAIFDIPVVISCSGTDEGSVGPKKLDRITAITEVNCSNEDNCTGTLTGEPRNLPWQTELVNEAGENRDKIRAVDGKGVGWRISCTVEGIASSDECITETGSTKMENKHTPGVKGELLVLADFEAKSGKAECSLGAEKETGEVQGTLAILQANGWGLQIS
jgi:hypothetical protein